jgi:hypothetical protein
MIHHPTIDIVGLLLRSLDLARTLPVEARATRDTHHLRSRNWISALAAQFRAQYPDDQTIRVFCQQDSQHRAQFGRNELLYDVLVARVASVDSARQRKELSYIQEVLWQVESEFARNSREALFDFNKLVLGSAHNKLFIGPDVHEPSRFLEVLRPPASACSGIVYAALVPHPDRWDGNEHSIAVWRLRDDMWEVCQPRCPAI